MWRSAPALLLLMAGCASGVPAPGSAGPRGGAPSAEVYNTSTNVNIQAEVSQASREYQAPPEAVWTALVQVYQELEIEIGAADATAMILQNPDFVVSRRLAGQPLSRYFRCGSGISGAYADQYRLHLNLLSKVTETEEGPTLLETTIEAYGTNPRGSSNSRVACTSSHLLERRISSEVANLVGG